MKKLLKKFRGPALRWLARWVEKQLLKELRP